MVIVVDNSFGQLPPVIITSPSAPSIRVEATVSWANPPLVDAVRTPRKFDPRAAGRRAVQRHAGALRKLAD
jgi:hypothetical protein